MDALQLDLFGNPAASPPPPPILVREHLRRRSYQTPKSGRQLRDEALKEFEEKRAEWLRNARRTALLIAADQGGMVSADDVSIPLPTGASPNLRGALFKSPWFAHQGFIPSTRPSRHANRISRYSLTQEGRAALAKLLE